MGLSEEQARTLVVETALGAAKMAIKNADVSLETLRAQVTSKGGTTFACMRCKSRRNAETLLTIDA